MKRSKIFLGASSCILAVAAFAAAKVQRSDGSPTRYYCTTPVSINPHARCVPYSLTNCVANGTTTTCFYTQSTSKVYTLYVQGKKTGTNTCGTAGICKNKVLYDGEVQ